MPRYELELQALRSRIKIEARVNGSDDLNITIDGLINEIIQAHCRTERYYENLVRNLDIPLTDGQQGYALPEDFADIHKVWWSNDLTNARQRTLRAKNDFVEESRGFTSEPRFYELAGDSILIFPYGGILATQHKFSIDYYKSPDLLENDNDVLGISKLIPTVIREGTARVLRMGKDYTGSQLSAADAKDVSGRQMTSEENTG